MEKNTVIFVTDKRQLGISNFLPGKTTKLNWTDEADENLCLKRIQKANIVVFPTPAKKIEVSKDLVELLKYNLIFETLFKQENCDYGHADELC